MSLKKAVICIVSNFAEDVFAKESWIDSSGALDKRKIEGWFKGTKIIWDEMDQSVTYLVIARSVFEAGKHEARKSTPYILHQIYGPLTHASSPLRP